MPDETKKIQDRPVALSVEELEKVTGSGNIKYFKIYCLHEGCTWEGMNTLAQIHVEAIKHRSETGHGRFSSPEFWDWG
ncbi:MAG TPA: hypothetical protein VN381_02940 [Anaerovoracaceae bacterium]|nr:hypothetical protein [Anaerovoracaceae bacterium]